jgi:hypothetical protein
MADYWKEVEAAPAKPSPQSAEEFLVPTNAKLQRQVAAATGWLWFFAGLTVINLVLASLRGPIRMTVSLFLPELIFEIGRRIGPVFVGVALGFDVLAVGFFVLLVLQAKACRPWAYYTAIALISLDGILIYFLTTLAGVWPFIFHAVAIYFLVLGLKAARTLNQRRARHEQPRQGNSYP